VASSLFGTRALLDVERAFEFLRQENPAAAIDAAAAISSASTTSSRILIGRRVEGELRAGDFVRAHGLRGALSLRHRPRDEVRVLALRHQRELGFLP
jgi:plasmid stabilization system protein ParE